METIDPTSVLFFAVRLDWTLRLHHKQSRGNAEGIYRAGSKRRSGNINTIFKRGGRRRARVLGYNRLPSAVEKMRLAGLAGSERRHQYRGFGLRSSIRPSSAFTLPDPPLL